MYYMDRCRNPSVEKSAEVPFALLLEYALLLYLFSMVIVKSIYAKRWCYDVNIILWPRYYGGIADDMMALIYFWPIHYWYMTNNNKYYIEEVDICFNGIYHISTLTLWTTTTVAYIIYWHWRYITVGLLF